MTGFASFDAIKTAIAAGQKFDVNLSKSGQAGTAGRFLSWWAATGFPLAGTDSSGARTNAAGSINFPDTSGFTKHLLKLSGICSTNATLLLYDRLAEVTGASLATATTVTINTTTLPRYSGAASRDVQCWLETTTTITGTTPVVHIVYTDDGNTGSRSGPSYTMQGTATRTLNPMPLSNAAAQSGVRSVESLVVDTASTAGAVSVVLIKPIAFLPMMANVWNEIDFAPTACTLPRIYDGASLGMAFFSNGTGTPGFAGHLTVVYG